MSNLERSKSSMHVTLVLYSPSTMHTHFMLCFKIVLYLNGFFIAFVCLPHTVAHVRYFALEVPAFAVNCARKKDQRFFHTVSTHMHTANQFKSGVKLFTCLNKNMNERRAPTNRV